MAPEQTTELLALLREFRCDVERASDRERRTYREATGARKAAAASVKKICKLVGARVTKEEVANVADLMLKPHPIKSE